MVRLVLVADVHNGPDRPTRPGSVVPGLLRRFVDEMNGRVRPDAVIDLGDRIDNEDPQADAAHAAEVASILAELRASLLQVPGNHDVPGAPVHHPKAIRLGDLTFLVLNTSDPALGGVGGSVSPGQIRAFERLLQESAGPVVVLAHHPLDDHSIEGNPLFAPFPDWAFTREREAIRSAVERSSRVAAVFSGHVHWATVRIVKGIPYVSVPSFLERWQDGGAAPGAYALATFGPGGRLRVDFRSLEAGMVLSFQHG